MTAGNPDEAVDLALLDRLRAVLEAADPVPPLVANAAREAYTWRLIDEELAQLAEDSLLVASAVRGDGSRLLTYQAGDLTIEVEVSDVDGRVRLVGQVVPIQPARLSIEQRGGATEVVADALGRFTVTGLRTGATRLCLTPVDATAPTVCTEWTLL